MAKGLPKWAIKEAKKRGARNIFAYAWTLVKRKGKRRKSKKTRTSNPKKTKKVKRRMARRKKRRGGGGKSIQRTAFKMIRLGALIGPGAYEFLLHGNDFKAGLGGAIGVYTGFDLNEGNFRWERLVRGWSPYLASVATTIGIPKIAGIIRRL